jgi:hypothetical protein
MKPGVIAHLRRYRRLAVVFAAGLVAVQAFLAGLVMAPQAALMLAPDLADDAGFAVICHGRGGSGSDPGTAPDPARNQHPCCMTCEAGAAPAVVPVQLIELRANRPRLLKSPFFSAAPIQIALRAVRAGPSQAPPRLD